MLAIVYRQERRHVGGRAGESIQVCGDLLRCFNFQQEQRIGHEIFGSVLAGLPALYRACRHAEMIGKPFCRDAEALPDCADLGCGKGSARDLHILTGSAMGARN